MLPKQEKTPYQAVVELLNQTSDRLDAYEYSPEILEFICDPHGITAEEGLTSEVDDIWDEVAASLQLTPAWCLEARITYTLSLGDRLETFSQLQKRLAGTHQEKFKAVAIAKAPRDQVNKYLDLTKS